MGEGLRVDNISRRICKDTVLGGSSSGGFGKLQELFYKDIPIGKSMCFSRESCRKDKKG